MKFFYSFILFSLLLSPLLASSASAATLQDSTVFPAQGSASQWSWSTYADHQAVDLNLPGDGDNGAQVHAFFAGTVVAVLDDVEGIGAQYPCGTMVALWNKDFNRTAVYCHLRNRTVNAGTTVQAGQVIGHINNTGSKTDGAHLHFAVNKVDNQGRCLSPGANKCLSRMTEQEIVSLPVFAGITQGAGGGGTGTSPGESFKLKSIGPLSLQVDWPRLPGMDKTLNELAKDEDLNIPILIDYIYAFSLSLAGIIAFIMLVYLGFGFIVSGESAQLRSDARRRLIGLATGIAILLLAFILLQTLNPNLTSLNLNLISFNGFLRSPDLPRGQISSSSPEETRERFSECYSRDKEAMKDEIESELENEDLTDAERQELEAELAKVDTVKDQGAIQECLLNKFSDFRPGFVEDKASSENSCRAYCMMVTEDPLNCREKAGTFIYREGRALSEEELAKETPLFGPHRLWEQIKNRSWATRLGTGLNSNFPIYTAGDGKTPPKNAPDDNDFNDHDEQPRSGGTFKVDNQAARECVQSYVREAPDTEWDWDFCLCNV